MYQSNGTRKASSSPRKQQAIDWIKSKHLSQMCILYRSHFTVLSTLQKNHFLTTESFYYTSTVPSQAIRRSHETFDSKKIQYFCYWIYFSDLSFVILWILCSCKSLHTFQLCCYFLHVQREMWNQSLRKQQLIYIRSLWKVLQLDIALLGFLVVFAQTFPERTSF